MTSYVPFFEVTWLRRTWSADCATLIEKHSFVIHPNNDVADQLAHIRLSQNLVV